ncbi:GYDIA family GHMP kinase [Wenyingzhuangia sp. IMCC45574]
MKFYSNGKLLISGEYLVLDGAVSLALPTKYGQSLEVEETDSGLMHWKSYNVQNELWFEAKLNLETLKVLSWNNQKVAVTLEKILSTAKSLNPTFLLDVKGLEIKTSLTFPNEWGLGTSSTLINNIAQWANINAFALLEKSFGGSGYDIACAQNNFPITYKRNGVHPKVSKVDFKPSFKENIFFVYLNQKQDSKEGIKMYRSLDIDKTGLFESTNKITQEMINATNLDEFEALVDTHENIISDLLKIETAKQKLFADYKGAVKSLGAWGGDFILVTGTESYVKSYFTDKGYNTILSYAAMILN